jgi:hypothetical protein
MIGDKASNKSHKNRFSQQNSIDLHNLEFNNGGYIQVVITPVQFLLSVWTNFFHPHITSNITSNVASDI